MIPILLSILSVALTATAQAPSVLASQNASVPNSDEQQLHALNRQWCQAEVKHDEATLQRILDDDFVFTDDDGQTIDKKAFLDEVRRFSMTSQNAKDDVLHFYGDTAIIVGTTHIAFPSGGKEQTVSYRYTVVYIKRGGQWRAAAEQLAKLAPPPPPQR